MASKVDNCNKCDADTKWIEWTAPDGTKWEFWNCSKGCGKWQKKEAQPESQAWWKDKT